MKNIQRHIVLHDVGVWLARTKTWLYSEVIGIGDTWETWVAANRTENLDAFPFNNIFSIRETHGYVRWFFEMVLFRIGLCKQLPSIYNFATQLRPDIIHSHFGPTGWKNLELVRAIKAGHVVSFYGYDVSKIPQKQVWKKRYNELFLQVDAVLCEGPFMASAITKLGCPESKIHIFPLGINLDAIPYIAPSWNISKPLRILMAASFVEKKGLVFGLQAVAIVKNKYQNVKLQLTIVGDAIKDKSSQNIKQNIDQIILSEGLSAVTILKGFIPHEELLVQAVCNDIFLSPSVTANDGDSEGGAPMSIIEMAAAGLIVVSTQHCDIPFVLGYKNRGLLVEERNASDLADVLSWLIENPKNWNGIAEENRLQIEIHHNNKLQSISLARIYEGIH